MRAPSLSRTSSLSTATAPRPRAWPRATPTTPATAWRATLSAAWPAPATSTRSTSARSPTIVIPGGGERVFGSTQDDELVFALPAKFIDTTAKGIEAVHAAGYARYPTGFHGIYSNPKLPGKYYKYLMPKK